MKANKQRLRKRPRPFKKTKVGATHKPSGQRKIVRTWLKQAGLWYSEGYPGYTDGNDDETGRGHKRGWKS